MTYKVTYLDSSGNRCIKHFQFSNEEKIINELKLNKCKILNIEKLKEKNSIFKDNISKNKIIEFLKQFSILLKSGIGLKECLEILKEQENNKNFKRKLNDILDFLDNGETLSSAFSLTNEFDNLTIGMIEAGESSGNLSKSMKILSDYYEREKKIKQKIKNSLYYPIILLIITFIVVIGIVTFIMPNYIKLFESYDPNSIPKVTRLLISFNKNIHLNIILFLFIIVSIYLIHKYIKYDKDLNYKFSKAFFKIPIVGKYVKILEFQRFSGIFSLLIDSGIEVIHTIEISSNTFKNFYLKERIKSLKEDILKGKTLYEAFKNVEEVPNMFLNLINVGENSSNLEEALSISNNYFTDLAEEKGKKITALFEPLIIVFVSIIVGIVVIGIALPIFNLINII